MEMEHKICIVIVTYDPDAEHLKAVTDCVKGAGCIPVISDNSPAEQSVLNGLEDCKVIRHGENKGIAYAQNRGIEYALAQGADIIGFFDQDSIVDSSLITALAGALEEGGIRIAAPVSIDAKTGEELPSHRIGKNGRPVDVFAENSTERTLVDIAISSGTFVKKDVFEEVGLFDESLFIDFVDIEWCLRCRKAGIPIAVISSARMPHTIGEDTRKAGLITITAHSPYRTYYKVRNAFLMFGKGADRSFCMSQLLPALVHNGLLIFDRARGREYRKYYFRAIADGLKKRDGKYEQWHERV